MKTQLEKDAAALSALAIADVTAIITASPVLSAALAGATVEAQRDAIPAYPHEVRSTGGQTTGWA